MVQIKINGMANVLLALHKSKKIYIPLFIPKKIILNAL